MSSGCTAGRSATGGCSSSRCGSATAPRLQCLLLVRDDFWLALSRFMNELEIDLVQRRNTALVDLFDPAHARKVLREFGRAFGRLPDDPGRLPAAQETFLARTIEGLTHEDKVVPVRLALFAEIVKGKPWTPATLRDVGGAGGVGVSFLEETFSARTADPRYRRHQEAARAVLEALLPRGQRHEGPRAVLSRASRPFGLRQEAPGVQGTDGDPRRRNAAPHAHRPGDRGHAGIGRHAGPAVLPVDARLPRPLAAGMARKEAEIDAERPGRALPGRPVGNVDRPAGIAAVALAAGMDLHRPMDQAGLAVAFGAETDAGCGPVSHAPDDPGRPAGPRFPCRRFGGDGTGGQLAHAVPRRSAAVWMAIGHGLEQAVWPLLKHSPDPTLRTQVIHGVGPIATDPQALLEALDGQEDVSVRRAMVLMAGELAGDPEDRPPARAGLPRTPLAQPLLEKLLDLYRNDPDPGLHAAAEWTLRRSVQGAEIDRIDRQVAQRGIHGDFGWYVNTHGHTMMVVPGPAQFLMGSPSDGRERTEQRRHSRRIRGSFSIAAKETTAEQFRAFLADNPAVDSEPGGLVEAAPGAPRTSVTWYEAAAYCNWLTLAEGLPESQCCYTRPTRRDATDRG